MELEFPPGHAYPAGHTLTLPFFFAPLVLPCQADDDEVAALELKKKRTFRKFTFRGIDLDALLDLTTEQLSEIWAACSELMSLTHARKSTRPLLKVRYQVSSNSWSTAPLKQNWVGFVE